MSLVLRTHVHIKDYVMISNDNIGVALIMHIMRNIRLAPVIFVLYLFLSFSTLFFIMILFNPTSSYLWLLSSQGTEVNKNSTSYTSVVSPLKKKKKKEKKIKKGSGARLA